MSWNIFKYYLKILFSEKETVFWILIYPVVLSTLFYLAFINFGIETKVETINLSVIEEVKDSEVLKIAENTDLFNIKKQSYEDAMESLKTEDTDFAIHIKENGITEFYTLSSGLSQTISKSFFDSYYQISNGIKKVSMQNQNIDIESLVSSLTEDRNYLSENAENKSGKLSVVFFYTILAMLSLLCGTLGVGIVDCNQANQSSVAERICISPTHKLKSLVSHIAAALCFQIVSIIVALFYMGVILKIDFEGHFILVFLICLVGSIFGISFGTLVGSILKSKLNIKIMIITVLSLLSCFMSGMMVLDIKYIIQSNVPLLANINPATLITDGIYSLYYYETYSKFINSISILSIEAVVCMVISYLVIRRQKYESI